MRRIVSLVALVALVTLLAACRSGAAAGSGLTSKTWTLSSITTTSPASQGVIPASEQGKYTIEFKADNTFSAKADCNTIAGVYYAGDGGSLTIEPGPSTLVACPPASLGSAYTAALATTVRYAIANGELSLTLSGGGKLQYT
jgi:heat shock protein HslJ